MARRQSDEEILAQARKRYDLACRAESDIRKEARIDLQFAAGQQWNREDEQSRKTGAGAGERPCFVFNKLTGPLNMVSNEARLNKPGLEVLPVDMSSDSETAHVLEGMLRHIEYVSNAEQVYETALEQSTRGSFGYFKVTKRFAGNKTFDQELRIERVRDQFAIYCDPFAKKADKSDMMWCIEAEWFSREEYEQQYGETEVARMNFFAGVTNPAPEWISQDGVLIANYWYVQIEAKKLVMIRWPDGVEVSEYLDVVGDGDLPPGLEFVVDERTGKRLEREDQVRHVRHAKLNGIEILEQNDWEGQWIPILPVLGEELYIEDKRYLFSLIRFARDPQRLYNFYRSSEAEAVMLGTKSPWIGVKGQFRDPRWARANSVPWSYLEYEPLDIAGNPCPPPQRNLFEPPIQALSIGAAQASDDIKATTNVFDASLGARSNETSGIAIRQRQSQAGLSNFHFIDNLNRAILQAGVILCDLIPKIYNTPREVRILGEDMQEEIVRVNQKYYVDAYGKEVDEGTEGAIQRHYDLTSGKYDVRLKVGPNYKTQREETAVMLTELIRANPAIMQVAGDIVFENLNFKGAEKIAKRLKLALPPALQDDEQKDPQEVLARENQRLSMQLDNVMQLAEQQGEEIRTKAHETQSRERIELAKLEQADREAALNANVKMLELSEKLTSIENVELLRADVATLQAQIAAMASGAATEQSMSGAASEAPPAAPEASSRPRAVPGGATAALALAGPLPAAGPRPGAPAVVRPEAL